MTPEQAKGLRTLLIEEVERLDPDETAVLALSGGTDSTTALFAMLASGRKPRCYTFYCQGVMSPDLKASRQLCAHFGLELVEVEIPWDIDELVSVLRLILPHCEHVKPTIVQCLHPWFYLYPAMVERNDFVMLNGLGGDDHYCMQRKVNVKLNAEGEQAVLEAGYRKCYTHDLRFSVANIHRYGERQFRIKNLDLYADPAIEDWFCQFPVRELHKDQHGNPFEKAPSIYAFADYYSQGAFYRRHDSYQKNSKLQELHEQLLGSPYNHRGSKAVIAIYRDIANGSV